MTARTHELRVNAVRHGVTADAVDQAIAGLRYLSARSVTPWSISAVGRCRSPILGAGTPVTT